MDSVKEIHCWAALCRKKAETFVIVIACLFFCSQAEAQIFGGGGLFNRKTEAPRAQTEEEIGVPVPVTGRVEALKGHEVQFEIRAESKTPGASVEFLIRTFPSAGKIVSLLSKPNERNKAIVTYYADPTSSADADAFAFAVRYRGGRYSSEMRYDISLVDLKTEIQVPKEVDFGEVMVGSESVQDITIRNLGNGPMERQIFLASPWHLLEPADGKVKLGPRGSRVIKIAFRPELMGETSYYLSFSSSKEGTSKLRGTGGDPFTVEGETLELTLDEATGERVGEAELFNPGEKPILVEARASTRIQSGLLEGYLLAPGKVTKVPVKLAATDTAPIDGSIQFFLKNGYSKSVRVIAPVVPGKIVVSIPNSISSEVINFEKVEAGRSAERGFTLTNPGGIAVPLEFHIPEPFRMLTNPGPQLGPLSSVNISVGVFPASSAKGSVDVTMNIFGNEQTVPLRLLANVIPGSGGSAGQNSSAVVAPNLPSKTMRLASPGKSANNTAPVNNPDGTPGMSPVPILNTTPSVAGPALPAGSGVSSLDTGSGTGEDDELWFEELSAKEREALASPMGFVTRSLAQRKTDPEMRAPEDLSVLESGSDSLVIGWTAPKDAGVGAFEVELRGMMANPQSGMPESVWIVYPVKKIEKIDRLVKARLENLNPASVYEFRVIFTTEAGLSSPPSEALSAETGLPMDWTYIYLGCGFLLLVGIGFLAWKVVRDRRPEVYQTQYVDV
jgi:hypothetical protein